MAALPKAFIFDCDGTLIDSMGAWLEASPRLLAEYGISTTPEDFAPFEHLSIEDECAAYHDHWGVGADGAEVADRLLAMMREAYATRVPECEGVHAFLDEVRAAGIPMAVATSTEIETVKVGLAAHGLLDYFGNVTTTEESGAGKDRPDVYNLALARLVDQFDLGEVSHGDVWVFEDAIFGLKSSGAAGYRRVGIVDANGRHGSDEVHANSEICIENYHPGLLDEILNYKA